MRILRLSIALLLTLVVATVGYLLWPRQESGRAWAQQKIAFQQATVRAQPLLAAIRAYSEANGKPPQALADMIPRYLQEVPATGLDRCASFEYRLLPNSRAFVVWYDLGSREGRAISGPSRYSDGDPGHAILVFTLDAEEKISGAWIDRAPEDAEAEDFDSTRWKMRQRRMQMASSLAETYRLYGMPRAVFEELLGPADASREVFKAPWELRINCPTGLLNHNALVYWPTEVYPQRLYGGTTEKVGSWIYIRN
jgi:hypothetical protein